MTDAAGPSDFYEFVEDPQTEADIEMANHYTATHPDSIFRRTLTIQRASPRERTILRGEQLVRHRDGRACEETVAREALRPLARELFGVELGTRPLLFEQLASGRN